MVHVSQNSYSESQNYIGTAKVYRKCVYESLYEIFINFYCCFIPEVIIHDNFKFLLITCNKNKKVQTLHEFIKNNDNESHDLVEIFVEEYSFLISKTKLIKLYQIYNIKHNIKNLKTGDKNIAPYMRKLKLVESSYTKKLKTEEEQLNVQEREVIVLDCSSELEESSVVDNKDLPEELECYITKAADNKEELNTICDYIFTRNIVQYMHNIKIRHEDIICLIPGNWLNDKVINLAIEIYKDYLKEKEISNILIFNTYFYAILNRTGIQKSVDNFKENEIFEKDMILIPIHLRNHWIMIKIDNNERKIEVFDSMMGYHKHVANTIKDWIETLYLEKLDIEISYGINQRYEIPQQRNGNDCGVFVLFYLRKYVLENEKEPTFRKSIKSGALRAITMHEIWAGKLLYFKRNNNQEK